MLVHSTSSNGYAKCKYMNGINACQISGNMTFDVGSLNMNNLNSTHISSRVENLVTIRGNTINHTVGSSNTAISSSGNLHIVYPTLFDAAFGGLFNVKASSINYSPMEHYCLTHRHPLYHPLISEH